MQAACGHSPYVCSLESEIVQGNRGSMREAAGPCTSEGTSGFPSDPAELPPRAPVRPGPGGPWTFPRRGRLISVMDNGRDLNPRWRRLVPDAVILAVLG